MSTEQTSMLTYKGYTATLRLDLRDVIDFLAERADAVRHEFMASVDVYLAALPVVLATEIAGYPDVCVLYDSGKIATQVWLQLLPQAREGIRFLAMHQYAYAKNSRGQEFSKMVLVTRRKQLRVVGRRRLSRTEVEALIGMPCAG